MGVTVKVTSRPVGTELTTTLRRAMLTAGGVVLAASDALAPTEPDPRHGVHMTETGFVHVVPGADSDEVQIGYSAFWARLQHEHLNWNHPHGGEAQFLLKAAVAGEEKFWETVAAESAKALGA